MLKISVIVCSHNGNHKIHDCLLSLENQTFPKNAYEVILVDDGSLKKFDEYVEGKKIKLIRNDTNKGLAESRNIGVRAASADIVAFTDDDCIPAVDWLEQIYTSFEEDGTLVGLSGRVVSAEVKNIVQKYIYYTSPLSPLSIDLQRSKNIFYRLYLYCRNQIFPSKSIQNDSQLLSVVGANMAFARFILKELNGFDPIFRFGGEEEELCYRFIAKKWNKQYQIKYRSGVLVKHKFEMSFADSLRRNYMYGRGNARIKQKHAERSYTLFPFPFLVLFFSFMLFVIAPRLSAMALFIPLFFYPAWIYKAASAKDIQLLFFPYFQFSFELANNLGWLKQFFLSKDKI